MLALHKISRLLRNMMNVYREDDSLLCCKSVLVDGPQGNYAGSASTVCNVEGPVLQYAKLRGLRSMEFVEQTLQEENLEQVLRLRNLHHLSWARSTTVVNSRVGRLSRHGRLLCQH